MNFVTKIMIAAFLLTGKAIAQEDSTFSGDEKHHKWTIFDDFDEFTFWKSPSVEISAGLSKVNQEKSNYNLANPGFGEIKLGYTRIKQKKGTICKYHNGYVLLSSISTDIHSKENLSSDIKTDLWRFGFGNKSGYAYKTNGVLIAPYYSYAFIWSKLKIKDHPPMFSGLALDPLDDYGDLLRFGSFTESGITVHPIELFSINFSYEKAVVFPRFLFWKSAGSGILEGIGQGLIDQFVYEVYKATPSAAPIINFILKNGISYGAYQLRKEKMAWPFDSAPPLTYDTFKIGVSFVFN